MLYLEVFVLDLEVCREGPTHLMHFFFNIRNCHKNLTFLTVNVVTEKNKSFKILIILKHLYHSPPPTFSFSLEQMSISMETMARNEDVRTHVDFSSFLTMPLGFWVCC